MLRLLAAAEFRGPGFQKYGESGDDFEMDIENGRSGSPGRIILLGDGTEYISDDADADADADDSSPVGTPEEAAAMSRQIESQIKDTWKQDEFFPDHPNTKPPPKKHPNYYRLRKQIGMAVSPEPERRKPKEDEKSADEPAVNLSGDIPSNDSDKTEAKLVSESAIPEKLVSPAKT